MGFINRKAGNIKSRGELEESRRQYALGGDEYKMMAAGGELALDLTNLGLVDAAMKGGGGIAGRAQAVDLVLHQRDERRDDDVGASGNRGRHLVA